jgi:hypothetical protein
MKPYLLTALLVFSASLALAQAPIPAPTPQTVRSSSGGPNLPPSKADVSLLKPSPENGYARPDAPTRRKRFINSTLGPLTLGRTVATAGISTWTNSPEEWGTKWEGFGRRVASNFSRNAIKQTTKFGLDEAFKLDSYFYRSKSKRTSARIRNALISPVTARDRNGKRVFGLPNLAGAYTSSIIAYEGWYPDRYDWKDGMRTGTISLGMNAAFNLFKEFVWQK